MQLKNITNLEFNNYQKWYGENDIIQYLATSLTLGFVLYFIQKIKFFFSYLYKSFYNLNKYSIFIYFSIENMNDFKIDLNVFFFNGVFKIVKRYWTKKKILKHFYTQQLKYVNIDSNNPDLEQFSENHIFHTASISRVKIDNNIEFIKTFNETIIQYNLNTNTTKDLTSSITKSLNKNLPEIYSRLDELVAKGYLSIKDKKELINNYIQLNHIPIKLDKGDEITVVNINNSTTSSKNASVIIEPGQLKNWPVSKGKYIYNEKTLLFLLNSDEDYRRILYFMMFYYKPDILNYNIIKKTNTFNILQGVSGKLAIESLNGINLKDVNVLDLKDSKVFSNEIYTVYGYLLAEYHKNKRW